VIPFNVDPPPLFIPILEATTTWGGPWPGAIEPEVEAIGPEDDELGGPPSPKSTVSFKRSSGRLSLIALILLILLI
jgi:hypothetical protein